MTGDPRASARGLRASARAPEVEVCRAGPDEATALAGLVAEGFESLALSTWLVPEAAERRAVLGAQLRLVVAHALEHGTVDTTVDRAGVAVWLPVPGPAIPGYDQDLLRACGRHSGRFRALDEALGRAHPHQPAHLHLALLAVAPSRQRQGVARALLRTRHEELDRMRMPAYLEASSPRSRSVYLRYGYWPRGGAFSPLGCPAPLWPMWREPG